MVSFCVLYKYLTCHRCYRQLPGHAALVRSHVSIRTEIQNLQRAQKRGRDVCGVVSVVERR